LNATSSKAAGSFHRSLLDWRRALARAFGREKSDVCHAGFNYLILAGLGTTEYSSKNLLHGTGRLIFYALRFA
jgi:hypothetical protein